MADPAFPDDIVWPDAGPAQAIERNRPYVANGLTGVRINGSYNTQISPADEFAFRQWVADNKVPFDPDAKVSDYDMRGFWRALQQEDPRAVSSINPNDGQMHYPDYWKTPLHETFSAESQWATPVAPRWNEQDQLVSPGGRIIKDERAHRVIGLGKVE